MPAIQQMEEGFGNIVNGTYSKLLDLNVPMSAVAKQCMTLMNKREELLKAYGVVTVPALPARAAGAAAAAPRPVGTLSPSTAGQYRMMLFQMACTKAGKQPSKDEFTFETSCVDEEASPKMWITTLKSSLLQAEYTGETPQKCKRDAEQGACEVALKAEYPEVYEKMQALGSGEGRGQKRKLEDGGEGPAEGKGRLSFVMCLLLERSVTKDDIVYTMTETDGQYVAKVSLPTYKGGKTFSGAAAAVKKDAETNAANAALKALSGVTGPAIEKHKAKKIAKRAESVAKLEAKKAAERAAA